MMSQRSVSVRAMLIALLSLTVVLLFRIWLFDEVRYPSLRHHARAVLQYLSERNISSALESKSTVAKLLRMNVDCMVRYQRPKDQLCQQEGSILKIFEELPSIPHLEYGAEPSQLHWTDRLEKYFGYGNEAVFERLSQTMESKSHATTKQTNGRKEIILTMAAGYDCFSVARFFHTLRKSGSNAKVVLFRNDNDTLCENLSSSCGDFEIGSTAGFSNINIEIRRYVLALLWIVENFDAFGDCDKFLVCDFIDLIFQRDPFRYLELMETDLIITEEGYPIRRSLPTSVERSNRTTIFNEPTGSNFRWVKFISDGVLESRASNRFFRSILHMPVLNSGVILGTLNGMSRFLLIFCFICAVIDTSEGYAAGQGILMYSYYSGLLSKVVNIKVLPTALSFSAHCVYYVPGLRYPAMKFDPIKNPFMNSLGSAYAIVHQIKAKHMKKRMQPWLSTRWNSSGNYC